MALAVSTPADSPTPHRQSKPHSPTPFGSIMTCGAAPHCTTRSSASIPTGLDREGATFVGAHREEPVPEKNHSNLRASLPLFRRGHHHLLPRDAHVAHGLLERAPRIAVLFHVLSCFPQQEARSDDASPIPLWRCPRPIDAESFPRRSRRARLPPQFGGFRRGQIGREAGIQGTSHRGRRKMPNVQRGQSV